MHACKANLRFVHTHTQLQSYTTVTGLFSGYSAPLRGGQTNVRSTVKDNGFLLSPVSASQAPQCPIAKMSSYIERLLQKDPLRDPEPDNDDYAEAVTPMEVMRRKVAVDFGNPFKYVLEPVLRLLELILLLLLYYCCHCRCCYYSKRNT
jgi:hypothetical protein